jgi:hypothetical protein
VRVLRPESKEANTKKCSKQTGLACHKEEPPKVAILKPENTSFPLPFPKIASRFFFQQFPRFHV